MTISKKKAKAMYDAVHSSILRRRLEIMLPKNGNVMYVPLKVDDILHSLETSIWKELCKVHGIDVDFIADKEKE